MSQKMKEFVNKTRAHFDQVSGSLLEKLSPSEDLTINLNAEESLFVRLNNNRVRQNTDVKQIGITLKFQSEGRTISKARSLGGNFATDLAALSELLEACRQETKVLPVDLNQTPLENNGTSAEEYAGSFPSSEEIVPSIVSSAAGSDLAGLYAAGPVIRASRNSKGQNRWFATENFFLDYSLYNGPKAAKGAYAQSRWDAKEWAAHIHRTKEQLHLLDRPAQKIKPGKYRTYLAPAAFSNLLTMLSWGALSASAWKQGRSPLKKLADGEAKLSPLFTLKENFELGLTPRFNDLGELAPSSTTMIEKGELKEMFVSSRTAKEYGLKSNAAGEGESFRSLDAMPGSLEEKAILRELGTGLYLSNLHYLNWSDRVAARITGMTRYACFWVEGGEIAGPIQDLRWDESLYDALGSKLIALTSHTAIDPSTDTYFYRGLGGRRTPGALIDQFTFTL